MVLAHAAPEEALAAIATGRAVVLAGGAITANGARARLLRVQQQIGVVGGRIGRVRGQRCGRRAGGILQLDVVVCACVYERDKGTSSISEQAAVSRSRKCVIAFVLG